MKRYTMGQFKMAEDSDGEWVKFQDVKDILVLESPDNKSMRCNCAEFVDLKYSSVMLPEYWICPAHGYKRL